MAKIHTTLIFLLFIGSVISDSFKDPRCPIDEDPYNPTHLSHPSDCTKFYKCEKGVAYELSCPRGNHWNSQRSYCDYPDLAQCNLQGNLQPFAPTIRPTPITFPQWQQTQPQNPWPTHHPLPSEIEMICPLIDTPGHDIFYPNTMDCNSYYLCQTGRAVLYRCPPMQHFNSYTNKCDLSENSRCLFPSAYVSNQIIDSEIVNSDLFLQ